MSETRHVQLISDLPCAQHYMGKAKGNLGTDVRTIAISLYFESTFTNTSNIVLGRFGRSPFLTFLDSQERREGLLPIVFITRSAFIGAKTKFITRCAFISPPAPAVDRGGGHLDSTIRQALKLRHEIGLRRSHCAREADQRRKGAFTSVIRRQRQPKTDSSHFRAGFTTIKTFHRSYRCILWALVST